MSLWRALMQGVGWRVGREMAEDLIDAVKKGEPEPAAPPPETPAQRQKRLRDEAARAEALVKAAAKKAERDRKEVDRELEALKKKLGR